MVPAREFRFRRGTEPASRHRSGDFRSSCMRAREKSTGARPPVRFRTQRRGSRPSRTQRHPVGSSKRLGCYGSMPLCRLRFVRCHWDRSSMHCSGHCRILPHDMHYSRRKWRAPFFCKQLAFEYSRVIGHLRSKSRMRAAKSCRRLKRAAPRGACSWPRRGFRRAVVGSSPPARAPTRQPW